MIRCLSLNPCLDKTVSCPAFSPDQANRVTPLRSDLGGKGLNVARVLRALGAPVRVYAFDFAGSPVRSALDGEGIPSRLYARGAALRVNLKIRSEDTGRIIEINEAGAETDAAALQSLLSAFVDDCAPGDWGVLSGSLPPGADPGVYREVCRRIHQKGCYAAVDCDGEALSLALEAGPDLIKPNREEFARLIQNKNEREWPAALRALHTEKKAGRVCLSLGADGALLSLPGKLLFCPAAAVPVQSTTGAGDSMLAGLLYALSRGMSDAEALCLSAAAAGATVMREGTLLCRRQDALRILPTLTVLPVPLA